MWGTTVIFHNTDCLLPEENPFAMANETPRTVLHNYFYMHMSCIQPSTPVKEMFHVYCKKVGMSTK